MLFCLFLELMLTLQLYKGSGPLKELGYIRLSLEFLSLILLLSKVKLLTRELEALKETGMQTPESLQTAEMFDLRLEKENQFNDFVAVKDAWYCTILIMIKRNCFSQTLQLRNFSSSHTPYFSNSLGWCMWIN